MKSRFMRQVLYTDIGDAQTATQTLDTLPLALLINQTIDKLAIARNFMIDPKAPLLVKLLIIILNSN